MSSLLFIVKSNIKNKVNFYKQLAEFKNLNVVEQIVVEETAYEKHAILLAEQATRKGFPYIIAVGGDGTINEVLNGVIQAETAVETLPVLGLLPYGTANDFSRCIQVKPDIHQLAEFIKHESYSKMDIGKCEFVDDEGNKKSRYFINIIDAGIGAMVVKKINASNKPFGAKFAFIKAITESILTYTPSDVYCKLDDDAIEEKILTLAIGNGPYFGNGLCIAPDAKIDDGYFSIACIYDISIKDYFLNVRKLRKQERLKHPKINYFKSKTIELLPKKYSCAIEGDGEFFGYAPLKATLLHNKINFLRDSSLATGE